MEGGCSDRKAVLESDFMNYIVQGNVIMADRGFMNMEEDFLQKGAKH